MLHIGTNDIHRRQEVDKEGLYLMILQIDVKTQSILCVRRLLNITILRIPIFMNNFLENINNMKDTI